MAENEYWGEEEQGYDQDQEEYGEYNEAKPKLGNVLPVWGNQRTMNINNLVLTNIQSSPYFKVQLYGLKTYHEVIDEIYYKIDNLEPWERGSRKTAGQTGMCGGVRGVGTGGIVSTSYCILYKLFTLKLTRKQLNGMLNHTDSPYIRGLGFMYIRYCQPPKDLYAWFEPYLDDEEEIDVKAGGGMSMTMGQLCRTFMTKLEWFDTLFPRIPVPIQKMIDEKLKARLAASRWAAREENKAADAEVEERRSQSRQSSATASENRNSSRSQSQRVERTKYRSRSRSHDRHHSRKSSRDRERDRRDKDRKKSKRSRSRDKGRKRRSRSRSPKRSHKRRSRSKEHKKRSKDQKHSRDRERSHRSR